MEYHFVNIPRFRHVFSLQMHRFQQAVLPDIAWQKHGWCRNISGKYIVGVFCRSGVIPDTNYRLGFWRRVWDKAPRQWIGYRRMTPLESFAVPACIT